MRCRWQYRYTCEKGASTFTQVRTRRGQNLPNEGKVIWPIRIDPLLPVHIVVDPAVNLTKSVLFRPLVEDFENPDFGLECKRGFGARNTGDEVFLQGHSKGRSVSRMWDLVKAD